MTTAGLGLVLEGVSKQFGETRALSDVSLSVLPGSVHALVGENGAGKSTLGRIVAGIVRPDAGRILLDGRPVELRSPRVALDHGIAAISQELTLVPGLSAAENVFLGAEPSQLGFVRRGEMRAAFRRLADEAGFDIPPDRPVAALPIAQQQEVEILRAISRDARLIVMDEPSARLSGQEVTKLHAVIRRLVQGGRSVLLISHFLNEVLTVADVVTVLRDGRVVRHGPTAEETEASLVEAMLGRALGAQFPARRPPPPEAPVVARAVGLSGPGFADVSFEIRAGEIVGLAGLVGSGRTELARALVGRVQATGGRFELVGAQPRSGSPPRFGSPREARRQGVLMIPESRREQGLFQLRSARENVSVGSLETLSRLGFVDLSRERRATGGVLERVGFGASGEKSVAALSGGNQQKVLFARAILAGPRLLVADEPTRGVDIGAKRAIYDLLVDLAADGMAILLISSEMEEILGLSHRVLVMRTGRLVAELADAAISEEAVLAAIFDSSATRGGGG